MSCVVLHICHSNELVKYIFMCFLNSWKQIMKKYDLPPHENTQTLELDIGCPKDNLDHRWKQNISPNQRFGPME